VPKVTAGLMTAIVVLTAVTAISGPVRRVVEPIRAIASLIVPAPPNLAYSFFLAVLAAAVVRRKRVAYWILLTWLSFALLVGAFVVMLVWTAPTQQMRQQLEGTQAGSLPWARTVFTCTTVILLGAVVVLVLARHEFHARVQPAAVRRSLLVFLVAVLLACGTGIGLVMLFPGSLASSGDRVVWAVEKVLGGAVNLDLSRTGRAPWAVNLVLGLLGAIALFSGLFVLLASQRAAAVLDATAETRLRELLADWGERDSLGYFATRRDKRALFSPSGKAAITYRVHLGVSLASGDPLGDPQAWGPAIEAWLAEARRYAWIPAVTGAGEDGATAYARAGLKVLEIGDEAVVHADRFDLGSRELRPVRHTVARLARDGYAVRIRRHAQIGPEEMVGLVRLAEAWRGGAERGFSMALSRLGDPADGDCVMVEALDPAGRTVGLLSFVPWGRRGLSLDLMRRDRQAQNGLTELMVAELIHAAPSLDVDRVSLNFAVFRSAFEDGARIGAGPVARAWRSVLLLASRRWQLESLYRANAKYRPDWQPRFLCFAERRELVKISLASVIAEGFLTLPRHHGGLARALPTAMPVPMPTTGQDAQPPDLQPPDARPLDARPLDVRPLDVRPEQVGARLTALARIRAGGADPYPLGFGRTHACAQVASDGGALPPDTRTGSLVAVAGRVIRIRDHGRIVFAVLRDWSGDLQVMLVADDLDAGSLATFTADVDLGDHLGVTGELITTRTGEPSVAVTDWAVTAKCLRPLPNPRTVARPRHLDLILRPQARQTLRARSDLVHALRTGLVGRGYLEVETPQLQPVHGGAAARPFTTHLNALDTTCTCGSLRSCTSSGSASAASSESSRSAGCSGTKASP
jgi:lysyl-tRNA synthetase class 2